MILFIIKNYWKQALVTTVIIAILACVYFKGRADAKAAIAHAVQKDLERQVAELGKVQEKADEVKEKVIKDRASHPIDDARDSCLLSNNPLEAKCIN